MGSSLRLTFNYFQVELLDPFPVFSLSSNSARTLPIKHVRFLDFWGNKKIGICTEMIRTY